MKKIIDGSLYNTETAKCIGEASYGYSGDFNRYEEELYLTKSGKYFLHGEGGPMSKYAVSSGQNSWSGGEKIIVMSRESAMKWAEQNMSADEYTQYFDVKNEDEGEESLNIVIPSALKSKLQMIKEKTGKTFGAIAIEAFENYLQKDEVDA
jgi:hypothetical protein